jgi:hypothetical protein
LTLAIICRDHRLLFIQAPRTGCTAIARVLIERFRGEQLPAQDVLNADGSFRVPKKHCSLRQLVESRILTESDASQLVSFTAIRNPFDSLASMYVKKRDKYQPLLADTNAWIYKVPGYVADMEFCRTHSFSEWLEKHYGVSWLDRLLDRGHRSLHERYTRGVKHVIKFERLQQGFEQVMFSVGVVRDLDVPKFNATPRKGSTYQTYYDDEARRLVEYVFREDLRRWGYSFDGVGDESVTIGQAAS